MFCNLQVEVQKINSYTKGKKKNGGRERGLEPMAYVFKSALHRIQSKYLPLNTTLQAQVSRDSSEKRS